MKVILTCGTFDMFHIGHLNLLKRCKDLFPDEEKKLIVGVSSDSFSYKKKGKYPIIPLSERFDIISSLKFVDKVFVEESLEMKELYISIFEADVFVIGDDWKGKFDYLPVEVIYLPRTEGISTTELIDKILSPQLSKEEVDLPLPREEDFLFSSVEDSNIVESRGGRGDSNIVESRERGDSNIVESRERGDSNIVESRGGRGESPLPLPKKEDFPLPVESKKEKTLFTFGKFDIIHSGIMYFLNECKLISNKIIIGITPNNSTSESVCFSFGDRISLLESLKDVVEVIPFEFSENSLKKVIEDKKIDIVVLGDLSIPKDEFDVNLSLSIDREVEIRYIPQTSMTKNNFVALLTQNRKLKNKNYFPVAFGDLFVSDHCLLLISRIFYAVSVIFDKYSIEYTLSGGSLIGLIRHSAIIPWDDDGDIMWIPPSEEIWEQIRNDLFTQFGVISPHTFSGKFGFSGFGHTNHGKNLSQCAVDFFELDTFTKEEDGEILCWSSSFPKQKFKRKDLLNSNLEEYPFLYSKVKSIKSEEVSTHLSKVFEGWNERLRYFTTHTNFGGFGIDHNFIPPSVRGWWKESIHFTQNEKWKIFPNFPEYIFISSKDVDIFSSLDEIKESEVLKKLSSNVECKRFHDSLSLAINMKLNNVRDSIVIIDGDDLSLLPKNERAYTIDSLADIRKNLGGVQIMIYPFPEVLQKESVLIHSESRDLRCIKNEEELLMIFKSSPFKGIREIFEGKFSVDYYSL